VGIGGHAWTLTASKSTKRNKAEIDGKAWMFCIWASTFLSNPPKDILWQASTEDQLRNIVWLLDLAMCYPLYSAPGSLRFAGSIFGLLLSCDKRPVSRSWDLGMCSPDATLKDLMRS
jgi:hypothetical protein